MAMQAARVEPTDNNRCSGCQTRRAPEENERKNQRKNLVGTPSGSERLEIHGLSRLLTKRLPVNPGMAVPVGLARKYRDRFPAAAG